jgi:surface antigen
MSKVITGSRVSKRFVSKLQRKAVRRRAVRYSLITGNLAILITIFVVIFIMPRAGQGHAASIASHAAALAASANDQSGVVNPLDQLSAADVAVTVARMEQLPEATAIVNQADSVNAELAMAPTSSDIVAKSQVVTTAFNSRQDIKTYMTVAGDTIPSIAAKFNVTSDSIRWSNNINTDSVAVSQKLVIPPVNGIVYTVQAGDTIDSLATKFTANKDKITAFNDAEIRGLQPGEQVLIPDGTKAATPTVIVKAPVTTASAYPWGGNSAIYGYNGYDYGYCTWYVASRISVPSNWGNANTWDNLAPLSGWTVSTTPTPGAIGQTDRGSEGHVAIIEAVSDDGTQIKYSDMNGLAGYGRVGNSDWTSASKFMHYITH